MVREVLKITNPSGLDLRPAGFLCKTSMAFHSHITFCFKGSVGNAKSVLSVLGAGVKYGDSIEIICEGEDEVKALDAIKKAIREGLGEQL